MIFFFLFVQSLSTTHNENRLEYKGPWVMNRGLQGWMLGKNINLSIPLVESIANSARALKSSWSEWNLGIFAISPTDTLENPFLYEAQSKKSWLERRVAHFVASAEQNILHGMMIVSEREREWGKRGSVKKAKRHLLLFSRFHLGLFFSRAWRALIISLSHLPKN